MSREFTFNTDCSQVQEDLKGATLNKGDVVLKITGADAWPRELNQGKKYSGVRSLTPGLLIGTFHMGSKSGEVILPLVATADEGCVQLTSIETTEGEEKKLLKGPAVISKILGIRRGEIYSLEIVQATIPPILRIV